MKKAKIMLATIAVLAVASGALAFKAKKEFANIWCKVNIPDEVCLLAPYTTMAIPGVFTTTDPCPEQSVYYTDFLCQFPVLEAPNHTVYLTND